MDFLQFTIALQLAIITVLLFTLLMTLLGISGKLEDIKIRLPNPDQAERLDVHHHHHRVTHPPHDPGV